VRKFTNTESIIEEGGTVVPRSTSTKARVGMGVRQRVLVDAERTDG
jgi:hypothetical protein